MGLWRWLQKKGSTGSIARWVAEHVSAARARDPQLSDAEVCELLFNIRFGSPAANLQMHERVALESLARTTGIPRDPLSLACAIWEIEIGSQLVNTPDRGKAQALQCRDIIREELERLRVVNSERSPAVPSPRNQGGEDQYFRLDEHSTKQLIHTAWDHADELFAAAPLAYEGTQGRHSVYVILGSILLAQLGQPTLWEWVIDEGAARLGNPGFQEFLQDAETREGLRRLYYHTMHCILNEKYSDLSPPTRQALIFALGLADVGPRGVPDEHRRGLMELGASLVADTAALGHMVRERERTKSRGVD